MNKITLYNKDARGQMRFWSIHINEDVFNLVIEHGVVNGESQIQTEEVPYGKAGRDIDEQLKSRMNSRINKKKDKGYIMDMKIAQSRKIALNSLGLLKPMLAQRIDKVKEVDYANSFIQNKYDGHRCLITKRNGKIIAYSRNGKIINTIGHITDYIIIDEGVTLDGELYCHGMPLNKITSLVKKVQQDNHKLIYICYDIMLESEYVDRLSHIRDLSYFNHLPKSVKIVPSINNVCESNIPKMLDKAISYGYEGLILRQPDYVYEPGKRSKGLIKIKKFLEDNFKVISVNQSSEGWAILRCWFMTGGIAREFDVSAPGTFEDKHEVWANRDKYIGKLINVKYANLTQYGIPFHPVATHFIEEL